MPETSAQKNARKAQEELRKFVEGVVEKVLEGKLPMVQPPHVLPFGKKGAKGVAQEEISLEVLGDESIKAAMVQTVFGGVAHYLNATTAQLQATLNSIAANHAITMNAALAMNKDQLQATRHADIAMFHHWPTWPLSLVEIFGDNDDDGGGDSYTLVDDDGDEYEIVEE